MQPGSHVPSSAQAQTVATRHSRRASEMSSTGVDLRKDGTNPAEQPLQLQCFLELPHQPLTEQQANSPATGEACKSVSKAEDQELSCS